MKKKIAQAYILLLVCCMAWNLSGCQPAPAASSSTGPWQVKVAQIEIKDSLHYVESVTQYDGSTIDVDHSQSPDAGDVYLIMDVTVSKTDNQSTSPFDWQELLVVDASGNSYPRLENDTFLTQYQYNPRITGLELRFGENSGWMAYEIPASSSTGKLTLVYTAQDSYQEIVLQN
jgi:hypothetical protein